MKLTTNFQHSSYTPLTNHKGDFVIIALIRRPDRSPVELAEKRLCPREHVGGNGVGKTCQVWNEKE